MTDFPIHLRVKKNFLKFFISTLLSLFLFIPFSSAQSQVNVSLSLPPAPPENAQVSLINPTQVELTWNASPSLASEVDFYSIFYKLSTDSNYPLVPQVLRFDSLPSYSEVINVLPGLGYDFKIFAHSVSGLVSSQNCASCEVSSSFCGDSSIDLGENCDQLNLNGSTCADFGYSSGALSCSATCQFVFSSCSLASGGSSSSGSSSSSGGTGGWVKLTPLPGIASSPPTTSSSTITVSYSGAKAYSPKKLKKVILYYRKNDGPWLDSGLSATGSVGNFSFPLPSSENATYEFDLVAYDNFDVFSPLPDGPGDTKTIYNSNPPLDLEPPELDWVSISLSDNKQRVLVSYSNARDVGYSGLNKVELWFKKEKEGNWVFTGKASDTPTHLFSFDPPSLTGVYYFALVLQDNAGNRSAEASGEGQGNVDFQKSALKLILKTSDESNSKMIEIPLKGDEMVSYKYQLNGSEYSPEIPIEIPLDFSRLKEENDSMLSIIGKNAEGEWQNLSEATRYPLNQESFSLFEAGNLKSENKIESSSVQELADEKQKRGFLFLSFWFWLVLILLLFIVLTLFFLWFRRRKKIRSFT